MTSRNILCLYHKDCLDGTGSAWAVGRHHPDGRVLFIAMNYTDKLDLSFVKGNVVYIVDFSFPLPFMREVIEAAAKVVLIDHHPRSEAIVDALRLEYTDDRFDAVYDASRSGCLLTWEYLTKRAGEAGIRDPMPAPTILQHISDRDLWQFKLPLTKSICAGLKQYPKNPVAWLQISHFESELFLEELCNSSSPVDRVCNTIILEILEQTRRLVSFHGHTVPMINCPRFLTSEALAMLTQDYPFAVGYYDSPEGRVYSLRSDKNTGIDIRPICQQHGGDGHVNAGGFTIPPLHPLALL